MKTPKSSSGISRRKFLTGFGTAAGAAVILPALKFAPSVAGSKTTASRPKGKSLLVTVRPERIVSRPAGSHLLPMDKKHV